MERVKKGGKGVGYGIRKAGDATVLLVGFPSVGKSTLINKLSNVESRVGNYDFTTLDVIPGVMEYNGARIQILDVPGIIEGASSGKGRGKEIFSVVRIADLVVILGDVDKIEQVEILKKELYDSGFRLDQRRPDVRIDKKEKGGIHITSVRLDRLNQETIKSVLREFKIHNCEVTIRDKIDIDQLIDCVMGNRVYVPSLVALNKSDKGDRFKDYLEISALEGRNIELLKESIWEKLGLVRIFLKKAGKEPDLKEPLVLRGNPTVRDVCEKIHRDIKSSFRFARVWGESARFPGQKLGLEHKLKDRDIVEIH